jgi:hypothetical protein
MMNWYKAILERTYNCGNYKYLRYYLQAPSGAEALKHVQRVHPSWTLLNLSPDEPPIRNFEGEHMSPDRMRGTPEQGGALI